MKRLLLVGGVLLVSGFILKAVEAAAQAGPVPTPVEVKGGQLEVSTPDGGRLRVGVDDSVRLDVSATTPPDTSLAVSGLAGGPVETKLTPSSLNALLQPECTQGLPELTFVGTTPVQLPRALGHADPATAWRATNRGKQLLLCCLPSFDGGVPAVACEAPADGGVSYSYIADPGGGKIEITGQNFTHIIFCKASGADPTKSIEVNVWEDSCVQ